MKKFSDKDIVEIKGWDFSPLFLTHRMKETPLPWDYKEIVKKRLHNVNTLLDMGTGGGEFLSTLAPLPVNTFATENYPPNISAAERNLSGLNVKVISGYEDSHLPFKDNYFDFIINRHEYYDAGEVFRILKRGGFFITQQVNSDCDEEILDVLGIEKDEKELKRWNAESSENELVKAGFDIAEKQSADGYTVFYDTGAVISYIKVINWLVPDFDLKQYSEGIGKIEKTISEKGFFKSRLNRFLIIAQKIKL